MNGSNATAEDVTEEVFVTLIRTLSSYEPQRPGLLTYRYGVARNVTRNRLRRDRRGDPRKRIRASQQPFEHPGAGVVPHPLGFLDRRGAVVDTGPERGVGAVREQQPRGGFV